MLRGEEGKLLALNKVIADALDEIETQENNVEILDGLFMIVDWCSHLVDCMFYYAGSVEGCSIARLQLCLFSLGPFFVLDKLGEVNESPRLPNKMKVVFDQARTEEASFSALIRDLCCSLRVLLSKKYRLAAELEGLGETIISSCSGWVDLKDGYLAYVEEKVWNFVWNLDFFGGEVNESLRLPNKMKVVFDQACIEEASFTTLMRDLCCSLRVLLSKKCRQAAELEGLREQGDAVRALENMKEIVARDSVTLGDLEQLLARARVWWILRMVIWLMWKRRCGILFGILISLGVTSSLDYCLNINSLIASTSSFLGVRINLSFSISSDKAFQFVSHSFSGLATSQNNNIVMNISYSCGPNAHKLASERAFVHSLSSFRRPYAKQASLNVAYSLLFTVIRCSKSQITIVRDDMLVIICEFSFFDSHLVIPSMIMRASCISSALQATRGYVRVVDLASGVL
nr:hypothetical protein [Tanacetum cinerariifolium]